MQEKVVIGIIKKDSYVVIVRRKQSEGKLLWQFPGGCVEEGEIEEQAIIRELKEETGVDTRIIKCLGNRIHPSTNKQISYWACEYLSGILSTSDEDLDKVIWVKTDKVFEYFTTPVFEPIINYLGLN